MNLSDSAHEDEDYPLPEPPAEWAPHPPLSLEEELLADADAEAKLDEMLHQEAEEMASYVQDIRERGKLYDIEVDGNGRHYTLIMPNGPTPRETAIFGMPNAANLLTVEFEKYEFLKEYCALWSKTDETIEAQLSGIGNSTVSSLKRLNDATGLAVGYRKMRVLKLRCHLMMMGLVSGLRIEVERWLGSRHTWNHMTQGVTAC